MRNTKTTDGFVEESSDNCTRKRVCEMSTRVCSRSLVCLFVMLCAGVMSYLLVINSEVSAIPACVQSLQLPNSSDYLLGCNGKRELCAKPYNLVAYATMHNAFATTQDGFIVAQHRGCIRSALVLGIRGFMLDLHLTRSGEMKICHIWCAMGSLSLQKTLEIFRDFLILNPREIVTIFWEVGFDMRKNITEALLIEWDVLFGAEILKSQLQPFLHDVTNSYPDPWPSLSAMIDSGQRLVMFSGLYSSKTLQGINHMKFHISQTSFNAIDKNHLTHACEYMNKVILDSDVLVINQFTRLSTLGVNSASTKWLGGFLNINFFKNVNREPYFSERVVACARKLKTFPTFIAVDFWESSDVFIVVDKLNNHSLFDTINAYF